MAWRWADASPGAGIGNATIPMLSSFSVAFWFNRSGTPASARRFMDDTLSGTQPGWGLILELTNLITANYKFSTAVKARSSVTVPALNTWVHIVVTHNNTGFANTDFGFYFDGKFEAGTSITTGSGTSPTAPVTFAFAGFLPAAISTVGLWSRAITPTEALALAAGAHPTQFREGLEGAWPLDAPQPFEEGFVPGRRVFTGASGPSTEGSPPTLPPALWPKSFFT